MSGYDSIHAGWYDLLYAERPYRAEVDFVLRQIRALAPAATPRLAEIACGTGTHAFLFEEAGCAVTGLDVSVGMLAEARRKAAAQGSRVTFAEQDMRALALPAGHFHAAVSFFDSIGYAVTTAGVLQTLRGLHRALQPGGVLVLEFWHGPAMLRGFDPLRVRALPTPHGELLRISRTAIDAVRSTATVDYTLLELRDDQTYLRTTERHENRFFSLAEMDVLLRTAGFQPVRWQDGFDEAAPVTGATWHVVVVAQREPGIVP